MPAEAEEEEGGLSGPILSDEPLPTAEDARPRLTGRAINIHMARLLVAMASLVILTFVVVSAFVGLWLGQSIENITRLLEIMFAPLVALVAAAVAFYLRPPKEGG